MVDKQDFSKAFKMASEGEPEIVELIEEHGSALGLHLNELFSEARRGRQAIEMRWLRDLRQYKGIYDPETLQKIHPNRSKAFMRLTRTKVKTVTARLMDLLFPQTGEQNWSIEPTPVPQLTPDVMQNIQQQLAQQGVTAEEDQILHAVQQDARERAEAMSREIEDQLAETRHRETMRDVIQSGNIFGTGILKGPLVGRRVAKRWMKRDGVRALIEMEDIHPHIESVKIWDFYPDLTADTLEDCEYVFQRHIYTKAQLHKLAKRSDFDRKAIVEYMSAYKNGDIEFENYEAQLSVMGTDNEETPSSTKDTTNKRNRYELKEFWGWVSGDELVKFAPDKFEDAAGEQFINAWILGGIVIKLATQPLEGTELPYFLYYYDKDETSLLGEGIPSIMRDTQTLFNSSIRQMLDNAAICAGPIFEVNLDLLAEDEDPTDLYPFRTILRHGDGVDANYPAVRSFSVNSHTNEYMQMAELFSRYADETTAIPKYLQGQAHGSTAGAGRTASGLSMMFGAANIMLKDQVRNFDDGITKPFIKAMYHWNMQFNEKDEIKGDMQIEAKGSASLVAKEVMTERLTALMQSTANEIDAPLFNRAEMWKDVLKYFDMENRYLKSQDEIQREQAQTAAAQEQARVQAVIQDAAQKGIPIDRIYLQLLQGSDPETVSGAMEQEIGSAA